MTNRDLTYSRGSPITALAVLATVLATVSAALPAGSEIYKWVDNQGNLHFSEQPPPQDETAGQVSRRLETGERPRKIGDPNGEPAYLELADLPDDGYGRFTRVEPWRKEDPPLRWNLQPHAVRIPGNTKVGVIRWGNRCQEERSLYTSHSNGGSDLSILPSTPMFFITLPMQERLKRLGYRGPDPETYFMVFSLRPSILELSVDGCILERAGYATSSVEMKVRFELWSRGAPPWKVQWQKTVVGSFKGRTPDPSRATPGWRPRPHKTIPQWGKDAIEWAIANAYVDALDQVLAEPVFGDFLDPVLARSLTRRAPAEEPGLPNLRIRYGDDSQLFDYERAKRSTVTVRVKEGHGSGFLISEGDFVMTNAHVVATSDRATVLFDDGQISAEVIYRHGGRDIAILKLDASAGVDPLAIAKQEPAPGEVVYVVGTPLAEDLQCTLTRGIVSAHRVFKGWRFFQTDAAVSPGSSGGPAFNERGEVVGIAVAGTFSKGGGAMNINYLIPIWDALLRLGIPSPDGSTMPRHEEWVPDPFPAKTLH